MAYLIIIAVLLVACKYFRDNYKLALKHINKLHLESESYLQALMQSNLIPEKIAKDKIEQMNQLYGEVKVKMK